MKASGENLGWIRYSALILSLALVGCKDPNTLNRLEGRYGGSEIRSNQTNQQILKVGFAQVVHADAASIVRFELTNLIQSGQSELFSLFMRKDTVGLLADAVDPKEIAMKATDSPGCYLGDGALASIEFCLDEQDPKKRELQITLTSRTAPSRLLKLTQGVDLTDRLDVTQPLALSELMARAKFRNYTVSQEAERLFQARQHVLLARANLLPHLNFATLLNATTGGVGGLLQSIGNLVPFLFPSNWFRFSQVKHLFSAERDSFASLRGNEMNGVEQLFYTIHRDKSVLNYLNSHSAWMKGIQQALRVEEQVGSISRGTADYYGVTITQVDQDRASLSALIKSEVADLAQSVALSPIQTVGDLVPVELPDLASVQPIGPGDIYPTANERSFEAKALGHMKEAAKYTKKEVIFGLFDPMSDDGLGFGLGNSIRISQSQVQEIEKRIVELSSTFEQRSVQVADEHNALLAGYRLSRDGFTASRNRATWLIQRHLSGQTDLNDEEFVNELTGLQSQVLSFASSTLADQHGWLMIRARIQRLLLQGFYEGLDITLPEDPDAIR